MQAHLQVGATYYIVVSGYQADAGAYQINVTTANESVVPSLPVKGRYAVAQASSITASSVTNSSVTGEVKAQLGRSLTAAECCWELARTVSLRDYCRS